MNFLSFGQPYLGEHDLHCWIIPAPVPGTPVRLAALLDNAEQMKARAFRHEGDGRRYQHYHGAMRCILALYVGAPPERLRFLREHSGKPRLAGDRLKFNLSHCAEAAVLGVSLAPVGVDIEGPAHFESPAEIAELIASRRERHLLARLAGTPLADALLHLWCRKEALLKADGIALMHEPNRLQVGWRRSRVRLNGRTWCLHPLRTLPAALRGYVASPPGAGVLAEFLFNPSCVVPE